MGYSENDQYHILESNGMFELYAYGNGKLLTFAPYKKITVQLATPFNMNGGETFTMDRSKNIWEKSIFSTASLLYQSFHQIKLANFII